MKKAAAAVIFIAAVCISFFAGQYLSGKNRRSQGLKNATP